MANDLLGSWGESLAANYLQKKRYKILAMNYRCRMGEIDIIAENKKCLIFVEVKLRKSDRFAQAREFVDQRKQERLKITASLYLSQNEFSKPSRFDVVEIYAPRGMETKRPEIIHLEDAFQ